MGRTKLSKNYTPKEVFGKELKDDIAGKIPKRDRQPKQKQQKESVVKRLSKFI